ncbi:hypothetical protein GRB70_06160 [Bradyrhizobium neotropicale]|nr:hypothetical protein [Bradyrhizobium neotropicale]
MRHRRCWLCGEQLGKYLNFCVGPMCCVTRTNGEPPCHRDCAEYAMRSCPFLSQPRMRRNEKNLPEGRLPPAGIAIQRNPGCNAIWTTESYKLFPDQNRRVLFSMGDPIEVRFFAQGRAATRAEVMESMRTGLPELQKYAADDEGLAELRRMYNTALTLLPPE